jgi:phosphopantothenoylcysteine decarboxylase/phosphopantothenate--cysteine ligase
MDDMRRLTNASTGALGSRLTETFVDAGHRVLLLRGEGATASLPARDFVLRRFTTNEDLARQLEELGRGDPMDAVFHAAALCDFRVASIRGADGTYLEGAKISSRVERVLLELEPALKVLPHLKSWFRSARIVGWKYELNGGREEALAAVRRQWTEANTDACVLNGRAWGEGFALCDRMGAVIPAPSPEALGAALLHWLAR